MTKLNEERIAELLRSLPAPPEAWVRAAQELPRARAEIDHMVDRAERDATFRKQAIADLESALRAAGVEPRADVLEHLRRRLER